MRSNMETFSVPLVLWEENPPAASGFPSQKTNKAEFDIPFDIGSHKLLNKQSHGWWSKTPCGSFYGHCNGWKLTVPQCKERPF